MVLLSLIAFESGYAPRRYEAEVPLLTSVLSGGTDFMILSKSKNLKKENHGKSVLYRHESSFNKLILSFLLFVIVRWLDLHVHVNYGVAPLG